MALTCLSDEPPYIAEKQKDADAVTPGHSLFFTLLLSLLHSNAFSCDLLSPQSFDIGAFLEAMVLWAHADMSMHLSDTSLSSLLRK